MMHAPKHLCVLIGPEGEMGSGKWEMGNGEMGKKKKKKKESEMK